MEMGVTRYPLWRVVVSRRITDHQPHPADRYLLVSLSNQLLDAASFLELTHPPLMGDNTEDDVQTLKLTAYLLREMDRRLELET